MFERLNNQVNPQLKRLSLGEISLRYTDHALNRCLDKDIQKFSRIKVEAGQVVEVEREGRSPETMRTVKLVVRFRTCGEFDTVLVIRPLREGLFLVVTCWLNHKDDNHETLNTDRIGRVA